MQLVGKLTEADLNDVQKDTSSRAPTPAALLKLLARGFALLMGVASIAAIAIVGALSVAFYGLTKLLGKIPPLRVAYQFLSRTYDNVIDRLGQKVLRDSRDGDDPEALGNAAGAELLALGGDEILDAVYGRGIGVPPQL